MDLLSSRVMVDLLTWNAIVAFSEQCEAKVVHVVLLFYLVVSSICTRTLAIGSCKSEKRAATLHLQLAARAAITDGHAH